MGMFSHTKSYLGVDFGTSSIKVVELTHIAGEPRLVTYGYAEGVSQYVRSQTPESYQQLATILKDICASAHTESKNVIAALPNFSVFTSVITVPSLKKEDLEGAVQLEAKKFVPMPIEETILDWRVLDHPAHSAKPDDKKLHNTSGAPPQFQAQPNSQQLQASADANQRGLSYVEVLITAAPKTLVEKYLTIFKHAKLNLLSLETESFALARALVGADSATVMIIDLGAVSTDIMIIESGVPVISRSIDVGGQTITTALHEHLGVDEKRAEQFKRDVGMSQGQAETEGMSRLIESTFQSVVNEIHYSLDLYRNRNKGPVEKIILAGGSSFLVGVSDYLEHVLSLPVYIGDAWQQVSYPEELRSALSELAPRFSIAIGLALRELV